MSPLTHLLASWVVAAKTTDNVRDMRLVTLAGLLPDLDGAGILLDLMHDSSLKAGAFYYEQYHHWLLHGIAGGVALAFVLACFARARWRVFLMALIVFHLHLICDLAGSRGDGPGDIWPIYYLGPFTSRHLVFTWAHQWKLDGWQNKIISVTLLFTCLWMGAKMGCSVLSVFCQKLDRAIIPILQKWANALGIVKTTPPAVQMPKSN